MVGANTDFLVAHILVNLFRIDINGQLHWAISWIALSSVGVECVQELKNGDLMIVEGSGETSIFRLSGNGQLVWAKRQGISDFHAIYAIAETQTEEIVLGGSLAKNNVATPRLTKLNKSGDLVWSKTYGATGVFTSLMPMADGGFLATKSQSTATGNGPIFKVDPSGSSAWEYFSELGYYKGLPAVGGGFVCLASYQESSVWELALSKTDSTGWPKTCNGILDAIAATNFMLDLNPWTPILTPYSLAVVDQPIPSSGTLLYERSTICPVECDNAVENCDNLTDDDGDKLVDCAAEDCPCQEDPFSTQRANLWYFGQQWGLDFSTDPATVLTGSTYTNGPSSVATDARGNLFCYTDGSLLYDRQHAPFQNGDRVPVFSNTWDVLWMPNLASKQVFEYYTKSPVGSLSRYKIA